MAILSFPNTPGMERGDHQPKPKAEKPKPLWEAPKGVTATLEGREQGRRDRGEPRDLMTFPNTPGMDERKSDVDRARVMGSPSKARQMDPGERTGDLYDRDGVEPMIKGGYKSVSEAVSVGGPTNLKGIVLRGEDLRDAKIVGRGLEGADFREADLRKATLNRVNAQDADFTGANLSGATVRGNLDGADFRNADLRYATIDGHGKVKLPPNWQEIPGLEVRGVRLS